MDTETINSWIFLAIAMASGEAPAKLKEISNMADGINHAVPTEREIQFALWFLMTRQLVSKVRGARYQLTPEGKRLYEEASSTSNLISEIWKHLYKEFSST